MKRLVFVDFDNVLFTTRFKEKGIGMPWEEWMKWCVEKENESYSTCQPTSFMKKYLKLSSDINYYDVYYVLTVVVSSYEANAKRHEIDTHFNGIFKDFIAVGSAEDKLKIIKAVAEKENASLSHCTLIEDDYNLLLKANEMGIDAVHVTKIANDMFEKYCRDTKD